MKNCVLVAFCVAALLSASSSICLAKQTLTVRGTGDSELLLQILADAFEANSPETTIVVPPSIGSNGGIKALIAGKNDLARTARPLKEVEKKKKPGMIETAFATSPIVFTVNTSVTEIADISSGDVIGVYNNKIRNWKELKGPDHKIYPVDREADDSSRNVLMKLLPGFPKITQFKVFFSVEETIEALTRHKYTIGFLPLPATKSKSLKILTLDGLTFGDPSYPLKNTFYLVSDGKPAGLAKQFIDFLFTTPAKNIMTEFGVVPINKRD